MRRLYDPVRPFLYRATASLSSYCSDLCQGAMYSVYMMASRSKVIYVGMTRDLRRRVWQHKSGEMSGFSSRYHTTRLVWYEMGAGVLGVIAREKEVKKWGRRKKVALIEALNPHWKDLAQDWFEPPDCTRGRA